MSAEKADTQLATVNKAAKVQQILTWILEGADRETIKQAIAETWPGDESQPLIMAAVLSVKKQARRLKATAADWCLEATRFLYQKQVEIGEYGGAMRAVKQISEMVSPKSGAGSAGQPTVINNIGVRVDVDSRRDEIREAAERVKARRISEQL